MSSAFLLAGETSGDLHGALLARELRRLDPGIRLHGVGGPRMAAEGVELLFHGEDISVVGLFEIVGILPRIFRAYERVSEFLGERRPDVFIPIDFPDFNFRLLPRAHRLGIPIVYYISPQLWAWRPGRVDAVRRYVTRMVVIFPFEEAWYAEHGVPVSYVGHPLVERVVATENAGPAAERGAGSCTAGRAGPPGAGDAAPPAERRRACRAARGWPAIEDRPAVAILPGSRSSEVQRLAPLLAKVRAHIDAQRAASNDPAARWLLGRAPGLREETLRPLRRVGEWEDSDGWEALAAADLALLASGTATLEGLLLGTPMIVVYRVNPMTYHVARRLIHVEHIAMANLIAGAEVVPEFIQDRAAPSQVAARALHLLAHPEERRRMEHRLLEARAALGEPGAAGRAAAEILEIIARHEESRTDGASRSKSARPDAPPSAAP